MRCHFSLAGNTFAPTTIWGSPRSNSSPTRTSSSQFQAQLDTTLRASIQTTTEKAYEHHWQAFLNFVRHHFHLEPPMPAELNHICIFMLHLSNLGLSYTTIHTYLSAISFVHKLQNNPDPTAAFIVNNTLLGIKNLNALCINQWLPITKDILHKLLQSLPFSTSTPHEHSLWHAIYLLTYHACLRAGEVTLSKNSSNVIQFSQLILQRNQWVSIQFNNFKHSQGRTPLLTIRAQPLGTPCPVVALQQYLAIRGSNPGQLFQNSDNSPVTIEQFAANLKNAAIMSSLPHRRYTTHSFRIGKATQMATEGQPEHIIRKAGRWRSKAYQSYIRPDNIPLP